MNNLYIDLSQPEFVKDENDADVVNPLRVRVLPFTPAEVAQAAADKVVSDAVSAERQPRRDFESKRRQMDDYLFSKGYVSEQELTPADLAVFKAGLR